MLYNQPYGMPPEQTWGDTPYINGNPATGTQGSIPPAASIEYPQREIVNLIRDVNIASPSNSDLHQLAKAIQSQRLNFSTDYGTANAYVAQLVPAPDDYYAGMVCRVKIGNTNAGDSTLALYPLGPQHVARPDGSDLQQYDLIAGQVATFVHDGEQWVLTGISAAGSGGPIYLAAPVDYYVNANTGDDSFDGSQAAVGTAPKGPFKTLQHASDVIAKFNLNGFSVNVHVADGAYGPVRLPASAGQGAINWIGNAATPGNCTITGGSNTTSTNCIGAAGQANNVDGFALLGSGKTYEGGISVGAMAALTIGHITWGQMNGTHNLVWNGGSLRFNGTTADQFTVAGAPLGNAYAPACWLQVQDAGHADTINLSAPPKLICANTPFNVPGWFVKAVDVGVMNVIFGSIVNGSVVTGNRYNAITNGVINTGGGGANYWPGSVAGTVSSGGQYI